MIVRVLTIGVLFAGILSAQAETVQSQIDQAMKGLHVSASSDPYSRTIEKMLIGYADNGEAMVGIAYRKIESFKPLTGIVIIHRTPDGFILHEALFPDIQKIKKAKDRKQVLAILKQFKNIPFDPHAEKSAVDGLSGATRYGIKISSYFNYMARRTALEMEAKPDWSKRY